MQPEKPCHVRKGKGKDEEEAGDHEQDDGGEPSPPEGGGGRPEKEGPGHVSQLEVSQLAGLAADRQDGCGKRVPELDEHRGIVLRPREAAHVLHRGG